MLPVRSNSAGPCGPRNQVRACQPIGVGSSAGSSAATGDGTSSKASSPASMTPGCPSRSTAHAGSAASAAFVCAPVQPAHHCKSETRAGPNAASHRRASSARAAAASRRSPSGALASHASGGDHSNWPDDQPPRR
jgi:hypothetical protein